MTQEQEERFNECIRSLPPRGAKTADKPPTGETPEKMTEGETTAQGLKAINKTLQQINKELHNINKNLSRR